MKRLLFGWVFLALLLVGAAQANYGYVILDVALLDALDGTTEALGINDAGQIVGSYVQRLPKGFASHQGFVMTSGSPSRIFGPLDGASDSWALGINSSGQVVGYGHLVPAPDSGWLLSQGTYTLLMVPGATITRAFGINAAGQVVGGYFDTNVNPLGGFLYSGGSYTLLNVPGSRSTTAVGINASGQIVGYYSDPNGQEYGFLLSGGKYTTLDVPGAFLTHALGINNSGQIVGQSDDHGFLYQDGTYITIDVPADLAMAPWQMGSMILGRSWDHSKMPMVIHTASWR
jgi:probable HAF family extracellular repeat protein